MIYSNILEMIGNTPVIQLPLKNTGWNLYLKLEKFNPGQSMKDRMALSMVNAAEKDGRLRPGGTIIESSSGNTAIGLAMIASVRKYKFIAVVDHHAAKEKIDIIRSYGGKIHYVSRNYAKDEVAVVEREATAEALSKSTPNSFFPKQADNLNNRKGYTGTLAQEIMDELGPIDILIGSIGTGGSISGTAMGLKKNKENLKVIAVEPKGSTMFGGRGGPYFQSGTGNPPGADIPLNVNFSVIDENYQATDREAFNTCRFLAKNKGILIGGSAGGVVYIAIKKINELKGKGNMVAIIPDGGEKYLSTIYNDDWMGKNDLFDKNVEINLERAIQS